MKTIKENNVWVELYQEKLPSSEEVKKEKSGAEKQRENELQDLQKLGKRYSELGLLCQSSAINEKIKAVKADVMSKIFNPKAWGYHEITSEEMEIWEVWLPSHYTGNELMIYSFDRIPAAVLTSWEAAKALGVFQSFTIRTPETKKSQDPILIGWLKDAPYLIARWGESLKPFDEIKKVVKRGLRLRFKFMYQRFSTDIV